MKLHQRNCQELTAEENEDIVTCILTYFNIVDISIFRRVSKRFLTHIRLTHREYTYVSDAASDNRFGKIVPNLIIFRLLNTFKGVRRIRCHGKINVVEILKYLELARDTVTGLEVNEANIDLTKLFKQMHYIKPGQAKQHQHTQWKSAQLERLTLSDIRKPLNELEIKSLTYACANVTHLDISGCSLVKNALLVMAVSELESLQTFVALRSPKLANEVLQALGQHCLQLQALEVGGLPNDYNEEISFEGVECLLALKKPGLKRVRFEYCTKIGDMAV